MDWRRRRRPPLKPGEDAYDRNTRQCGRHHSCVAARGDRRLRRPGWPHVGQGRAAWRRRRHDHRDLSFDAELCGGLAARAGHVVAKLQASLPMMRDVANAYGLYEREVLFYRELAST